MEAQGPWGHLSQVWESPPCLLSHRLISHFCPLSPQQPLSRPCNVKLFPSSCSSEPSFVFYEFLELGSSALHARASALQDTRAVLPTLATWIPVTLGHRNTHPCMSQDEVLDYDHRQWLLPNVLTCPFITAVLCPSVALWQLPMWP